MARGCRCGCGWSPGSRWRCPCCSPLPAPSSTGGWSSRSTAASTASWRRATTLVAPARRDDGCGHRPRRGRRDRRRLAGDRPRRERHPAVRRRRRRWSRRATWRRPPSGTATSTSGASCPLPRTPTGHARVTRRADQAPTWWPRVRRDHRDEALRELLCQLSLAGLGALLVAALVGERLARLALRPVERYRRRAGDIAAGGSGLRLEVPEHRARRGDPARAHPQPDARRARERRSSGSDGSSTTRATSCARRSRC